MAKTSKKVLDELLLRIETQLTTTVVETARKLAPPEKTYLLLLCYYDRTTDATTPYLVAAPQRWRDEAVKQDDAEERSSQIWSPQQSQEFPQADCEGDSLAADCAACYEALFQASAVDDEKALLPFRKMLGRVALTLNGLAWTEILDTTDDFVVVASDWSGFWIQDDFKRSVPKENIKQLRDRGFTFNTERDVQAGLIKFLKSKSQLPPSEQIAYWGEQLDLECRNEPNDLNRLRIGAVLAFEGLKPLGVAAIPTVLSLLDNHVDAPGRRSPNGDFLDPLQRKLSVVEGLADFLWGLRFKDPAYEAPLVELFTRSCRENEGKSPWNLIPMRIGTILARSYGYHAPLNDRDVGGRVAKPEQVLTKVAIG